MDAGSRSPRLSSSLYSEKAPYLISLFVGAFAWLVSYTVARYEKVPVIVYSIATLPRTAAEPDIANFAVSLRNISSAQAVSCVALHFRAAEKKADAPPPLAKGPVTLLTNSIVRHSLDERDGSVVLEAFSMQPQAGIQVQVSGLRVDLIRVFTSPCTSVRGNQAEGLLPILKEESLETVVLEKSLLLLWGGLVAWALALAAVFGLSRQSRDGRLKSNSSMLPTQDGREPASNVDAPTTQSEDVQK